MSERITQDANPHAAEQSDETVGVEPRLHTGGAERFKDEYEFQRAVIEIAEEGGWEWFHIPRSAYRYAIGQGERIESGFPDLMLRRRDIKGNCHFIVAELKTDSGIVTEPQQRFLEDFAQIAPSFILRCKDWDYIVDILENGPPDTNGEIIEPSLPVIRNKEWLPPERNRNAIVRRIANELKGRDFPRGDLAELRRMKPDDIPPSALWRILVKRGLSGEVENQEVVNKWALVVHGIALMTPNAHDISMPIGKALFEGGESGRKNAFYHELRLTRLLSARGATLEYLLTQLFRMMGNAGQPFDWRKMATLILCEEDDAQQAEKVRLEIAKTYYETEYRNTKGDRDASDGDA